MFGSIQRFFSSEYFMPHGHCYLWKPALVTLEVGSNGLIAASYLAISATLGYLVYRVRDIPFRLMYLAFGLFIVTCGFTHIFDVWVIWHPDYWVDSFVRCVTALASVGTAVALPSLVPKAVAIAHGARAAHERGIALETMVKDLGTMYERTKEVEQLKTQFFANVSHELRTPLALILGPVEQLLAKSSIEPEQRDVLQLIRRNARLLLKQVNDLLDVSKLEAGKLRPRYAHADIARLARLAASHFEPLAAERGLSFHVDAPAALPADFDRDQVERVVFNLLSNAFKFTPAGGVVRLRVDSVLHGDARFARIRVGDSGPGVAPEHRMAVFDRFRQLEGGSTRRFGGSGLGLAIAKDFVGLHGGTIRVDTADEGGALFTVEIPVTAPFNTPVTSKPPQAEDASEAAGLALEELKLRIGTILPELEQARPLALVIEDNAEMARFVQGVLDVAYRTEVAFDGEQGLTRALERTPDVIVSDVMMPRMSGDAFVRALRQRNRFDEVPIVLLTAKADDELRVQLLREGAQDYVMKPFSPEELLARVDNLVTMKRAREVLQRELATHERNLESLAEQLGQRRRELESALDSTRVAREQAERASQAKSNLLNAVSHELRTPLTTLHLLLARVRAELGSGLTDAQERLLMRMSNSSTRLTELVDSLLEYGRIQREGLRPELRLLDLNELVSNTLDELRPQAEARKLVLSFTPSADEANVLSDARLVRLIVVNLVANAIKFTERGGVEVRIEHTQEGHRVSVHDSGRGIHSDDLVRIFVPFERGEPTAQKHTPGVGLGLALVREMVSSLEGRLELTSSVGSGSTFSVVLPGRAQPES